MRNSGIPTKERLTHIQQAIGEIETFTQGTSKESFLSNPVLISATLFQFTIIGEAIIHIDNELLAKYDYPWYKVRSFRNFILHEYHAIEYRIVWEAINKDLPGLKKIINQILNDLFQPPVL